MRKVFLLALPLASLLMCVGCDESSYGYGQPSYAPASSQTAAAKSSSQTTTATTTTAATTTATTYRGRNSTTQPLPSGYGYMHEKDLTGGRLPAAASSTTQVPTVPTNNGI